MSHIPRTFTMLSPSDQAWFMMSILKAQQKTIHQIASVFHSMFEPTRNSTAREVVDATFKRVSTMLEMIEMDVADLEREHPELVGAFVASSKTD